MLKQIPPTEDDIIAEAIAGTEQEIFDEALGDPKDDDDGDTSLEEMDDVPGETEAGDEPEEEPDGEGQDEGEEKGEDEPDDPDATSEADGEEPEPEQETRGQGPRDRIRREIDRRREIEQELATLRAQNAALQVHLQTQQRPQQQQEQPAAPDIWSDPEAWAANQRAQIEREFTARHVNASLTDAREEHGEEFDAAYKALTSMNPGDPIARATVQRIYDSPNPGRSLMRWHGEQQTLREIGGDPSAYRQRVARELMSDPEFRRELLRGMRGEAMRGDGGRPRTSTRLPKSLNGASGGGSVRARDPELYNDSDASVFAFAMK
jgi:hypothetical protein